MFGGHCVIVKREKSWDKKIANFERVQERGKKLEM
jgi:hypothetical protein